MGNFMKETINIKDVAERANVSIATVSNVINGKGRVSTNTISKVKKVIEELNYSPSMSARNLKTKKSHLIGVIVPTSMPGRLQDNPFYWDLVTGIEEGARDKQFHVILMGVADGDEKGLSIVKERQLDGLIVVGGYEGSLTVEQIRKLNVPSVFMDSYISDPDLYQVCIDDKLGAYQATKHLIDLGHENIAILLGDIPYEESHRYGVLHERILGYKEALDEKGIAFDSQLIISLPTSMEGGYKAAKEIAKRKEITAVFSFSDVSAMGLLRGFDEMGINVPTDISVVGFDDLFLSEYTSPPLTTVHQDIVAKGQTAIMHLLDQIENKRMINYRKVVLPIEMKVRKTTSSVQC
ncbi:LacI family DNA-binding transcriptional regulator [Evansella cellulosilytica]|uniref:Transcriptional regulator, LacI family n=1 Tax=Evansella cellulosilytica (strain ATCC 21833 / DSM 2522 / FERM P-1141 / JCM 9156 / N-4) TaxID=649639 RepID=E6TU02_EVAC2|nr:LacI family DNA-binding transcriptional regulator [Evansella cellulosilytica]ADU32033.1 transcriptional regulator, LacI family [Evansella cellulosilytica DSM 2522]